MIKKLKEKAEIIFKAKNTVMESKKRLILVIITAACAVAVFVGFYFFTGDIKYIIVIAIAMIPLIIYAVYSTFKEKRQDKSSEKDKQEFLSGSKYRRKEWKDQYYNFKEKHTFETISKKGMIHDLKRRYRKKNITFIRIGLLFITGSVFIFFIPMPTLKDQAVGVVGILLGGIISSVGVYDMFSGPVQRFITQQTQLNEIESSYVHGKMMSFKDNGINIGSRYTVIYTMKEIYAINNDLIKDMTRKMVRVKQYENSLYSGQEYRYYVTMSYDVSDGITKSIDVRLDEFQCEMIVAEWGRRFYLSDNNKSVVLEKTEDTVST